MARLPTPFIQVNPPQDPPLVLAAPLPMKQLPLPRHTRTAAASASNMPAASSSNLAAFSSNGVTPHSNMVSSNVVQGVASSYAPHSTNMVSSNVVQGVAASSYAATIPHSNMVSSNVVQGVTSSNAATINEPNLELEGSHSSQRLFLPDRMTPLAPLPYALSKDLEPRTQRSGNITFDRKSGPCVQFDEAGMSEEENDDDGNQYNKDFDMDQDYESQAAFPGDYDQPSDYDQPADYDQPVDQPADYDQPWDDWNRQNHNDQILRSDG